MSYKYDFGDGRLGDCEISDGVFSKLNSYARVTKIDKNVITIDAENKISGEMNEFAAGETILIHISATNGTDAEPLGKYQLAQIDLVVENVLTLNQKVFDCDLNYCYVQIISVPQFKNLTLKNATITPPPFDPFKFIGGILTLQVFDTFEMQNSFIDLTDCGIPHQKKMTYRPLTLQELKGETDGSLYAGQENYITADNLLMNAGDGVFFVQANEIKIDKMSRIGNPESQGRALCRGATDSANKPTNVTNIGGSTLLIVGGKIEISPENISKYRGSKKAVGRGLSRCYIASKNKMAKDEKLYSYDILEDKNLVRGLGVEDYGSGYMGTAENPNYEMNNYAAVKYVYGKRIYYETKTLSGMAALKVGALIILQDILSGKFCVTRILGSGEGFVEVGKTIGGKLQIITVAEYKSLTLGDYSAVRGFDGEKGGVLAIAVSGILKIEGEVNAKVAETREIGNSQSNDRLQVGSMFILGRRIEFGEKARLVGDTLIIGGELVGFESVKTLGGNNFVYEYEE